MNQGYTCSTKGCSCGKHFPDYARKYGIISATAERYIRAHEVELFGQDSTWRSE